MAASTANRGGAGSSWANGGGRARRWADARVLHGAVLTDFSKGFVTCWTSKQVAAAIFGPAAFRFGGTGLPVASRRWRRRSLGMVSGVIKVIVSSVV